MWSRRDRQHGLALLEVVLAMTLFFLSAAVIAGGLHTSIRAANDIKLEVDAADLAVTVVSELQVGLIELADTGATYFEEPFGAWTYDIVINPGDDTLFATPIDAVQITIANPSRGYRYRIVQMMPNPDEAAPEDEIDEDAGFEEVFP